VIWGTLQLPFPSAEVWRMRLEGNAAARVHQFVGVVGDEIVATCGLHGATTPRRQHVWSLGMGVAGPWQGRRVGRALMRHLTDLADALEVARLELDVYGDNDRAIALYTQFGFVREGVKRLEAWRENAHVDAVVMARVR
jgi:putative acetyltransferase